MYIGLGTGFRFCCLGSWLEGLVTFADCVAVSLEPVLIPLLWGLALSS